MTSVNPYSQIGLTTQQALQSTQRATNDPNQLGIQDFMTLMVAQLKNQDPTKPQESSEFLAQIAQFGTVSGIEEMNGSLNGLVGSLSSNSGLQAASLVGRDVVSSYNVAPLEEGGVLKGVVELPASTTGLVVQVKDMTGRLVDTVSLGPNPAGVIPFEWDGVGSDGKTLPPGMYSVTANANIGDGTEAVATFTRVKVDSVSMGRGGGDVTLNLAGGATMSLSQVREFH